MLSVSVVSTGKLTKLQEIKYFIGTAFFVAPGIIATTAHCGVEECGLKIAHMYFTNKVYTTGLAHHTTHHHTTSPAHHITCTPHHLHTTSPAHHHHTILHIHHHLTPSPTLHTHHHLQIIIYTSMNIIQHAICNNTQQKHE
jgi:hypothetical protein